MASVTLKPSSKFVVGSRKLRVAEGSRKNPKMRGHSCLVERSPALVGINQGRMWSKNQKTVDGSATPVTDELKISCLIPSGICHTEGPEGD